MSLAPISNTGRIRYGGQCPHQKRQTPRSVDGRRRRPTPKKNSDATTIHRGQWFVTRPLGLGEKLTASCILCTRLPAVQPSFCLRRPRPHASRLWYGRAGGKSGVVALRHSTMRGRTGLRGMISGTEEACTGTEQESEVGDTLRKRGLGSRRVLFVRSIWLRPMRVSVIAR